MLIYTHNLAPKLFGFAMSRDQLKTNTELCGFVDDPSLTLDIDLAVDFNSAIRGDEAAAERFTNTLILSSSYIDYSTADFYTSKMIHYPVFDYHVDRINYIFNNIDNPNIIPGTSLSGGIVPLSNNTLTDDFSNQLKNALKDCLNSPCNLFAQTSENVASMSTVATKMNSTTMPPFSELKGQFFTVMGGVKETLFKRVPDAVQNTIIELSQLGHGAFTRSVDMVMSKNPVEKQQLINNALAGRSLDSGSTAYTYVPDLQSYFNAEELSGKILNKVAQNLGGCFNRYQHIYRYEPFNPDHNLSFTNPNPLTDKVAGDVFQRNSFGNTPIDYNRTNEVLNVCKRTGISGTASPSVSQPYSGPAVGSRSQYERLKQQLQGSSLIGKVPADGAKYSITTGSLEEWAQFFTALGNVESGFNTNASFTEANGTLSEGLYSLTVGEQGLDKRTIYDPNLNTQAAIKIFEKNYFSSNNPEGYIGNNVNGKWVGGSAYWGPLRTLPSQAPGRDKRESNDLNLKLPNYK